MIRSQTVEQWREEPFRVPDVWRGYPNARAAEAIWYGPGGQEGDYATMVEIEPGEIIVTEYTNFYAAGSEPDDPSEPYGLQKVTFDTEDIIALLKKHGKKRPKTPKELARWAASIGVAEIAYWGGEDSWASELPS
jgi:hypothetical protein